MLMDAFSRTKPPEQMSRPAALGLLSGHTEEDGLTLLRLFGKPSKTLVEQLRSGLKPPGLRYRRYDLWLFGSGVGREPQNLVVAASTAGLSLVNARSLRLWPVSVAGSEPLGRRVSAGSEPASPTRQVTLEGYLIRLKGGALALDLPHWEMGAQRYLLIGDQAVQLDQQLAKNTSFPTSGDIGSDGDTSATLREALGGGGFKRSDVRFSPVAVSLEGQAQLLSQVHPDRAMTVPPSIRGNTRSDPRLPYGGTLYELTVSEVRWTLNRPGWTKLTARLRPKVTSAIGQIRAGKLGAARASLDGYLAAFGEQLTGASFVFLRDLETLSGALAKATKALGPDPSAYAIARQCDRVLAADLRGLWSAPRDIMLIRPALFTCATTRYQATATRGPAGLKTWAAARLIELLAFHDPAALTKPAASDRGQRKADAVQARFSDVAPLSEVPPLEPVGDPPAR